MGRPVGLMAPTPRRIGSRVRRSCRIATVIGGGDAFGTTLRNYYAAHGGWANIGWTHKHCPGTCTLDMTADMTWGRMQDFQHDPDGFGGTFDTIQVPVWDQTHAYLVDSVFWPAWAAGGRYPIGIAIAGRGSCPAGSSASCVSYQKFHLGLVSMDSFTGRHAVFCPDLNGDQRVKLADLIIEAGQNNQPPIPPAVEVQGDDYKVDLADLIMMAGVYLLDCHV